MAVAIDLTQPDAKKSRTELTLSQIARAWQSQPHGRAFTQALVDFLRIQATPSTVRSYSYSILELFEWFAQQHGGIPTPDRITRVEAADYDRWLRGRRRGLGRARLAADPRRRLDLAIWDIIDVAPDCDIEHIRAQLSERHEFMMTAVVEGQTVRGLVIDLERSNRIAGGLGRHLACLTRDKLLTRQPTIEELRRRGLPFLAEPDPGMFRYQVSEQHTPAGPDRSSGIVTKLTALSSLWHHLATSAENVEGRTEPLLRYNIWSDALKRARGQAGSHQAAGRAQKTPTIELFIRLLATAFERTHGPGAVQAATAATYSQPVPYSPIEATFKDLRDRALLLMLLQPGGPRAGELGRMRRGHITKSADGVPVLTIVGKGGTKRVLPVPAGAYGALEDMSRKIGLMAEHQGRYGGHSRALKLLDNDAPLLPRVSRWGANAGVPSSRGLTRAGISMALRRRAVQAGIGPGTPEFARVHPHGFRHLFAKTALESGTKINVIQAMMGHASGSTTLRYMEEHRPEALVAEAFKEKPPEAAAPVTPAVGTGERVAPLTPAEVVLPRQPKPVRIVSAEPPPVLPAAEERPLVAVGAAPGAVPDGVVRYWQRRLGRDLTVQEHEQLAACSRHSTDAGQKLCQVYAMDWGEKGRRQRMALSPDKQVEATAMALSEMMASGRFEEEMSDVDVDQQLPRMARAYAGVASGLIWWGGYKDELHPNMPVPSLEQMGRCSEDDEGLCERLAELWRRWMLADTSGGEQLQPELRPRGPMSACALVGWVSEMLEQAQQTDGAVRGRAGRWVAPLADWDDTQLANRLAVRRVFREHDQDKILWWFTQVAWQYRTSRGRDEGARETKVVGRMPVVPQWYGHADPLVTLDHADRAELFDLMDVLTGHPQLSDGTMRFGAASRKDLAEIAVAMRRYDEQLDLRGLLINREEQGEQVERSLQLTNRATEEALSDAQNLILATAHRDFDLAAAVQKRVKQHKAATRRSSAIGDPQKIQTVTPDREKRVKFYLRVLGQLFGKEARTDPMLALVLSNRVGALKRYRDLLKPDERQQTIVHDPDYARDFALATGAHSECVARRMARNLWESWRFGTGQDGAFKRADDLLDLAHAMVAFRVPCPGAQEMELRARIGAGREPVAIYERWARLDDPGASVGLGAGMLGEIGEEAAEFGEQFSQELALDQVRAGGLYVSNPAARPLPYTRRAAALLPTPIEMRWATLTSR